MLAALSYVDGVAINHAVTAVNAIEALRPHVYVKGPDYRQTEDDITGNIIREMKAIESVGGSVYFTENITFSSTSLLNNHFDVFDPDLRTYLNDARSRGLNQRALAAIDKIANMRVLMVGEAIVDEYSYVSTLGLPSKEPVVSTLLRETETFMGGVIAAANHLASFVRQVDVLTCLGGDGLEPHVRAAIKPNVNLHPVFRLDSPTLHKKRYVDIDFLRKLFEIYVMDDTPLSGNLEAGLIHEIETLAPQADLVVVTDFGHGLITPLAREALYKHARFLAVNTQTNSGNRGYNLVTKYPRVDFVCIDAPEARLAVSDKEGPLEQVARQIAERVELGSMIVTHGRHGCLTYNPVEQQCRRIPAFTRRVVDTMGAGDAFFSLASPLIAAGTDLETTGFIGNVVGAIKVGIVGHRSTVEKDVLLKSIKALLT
jgi:bifunctional ADP-heptose synthase (sugar kinase/adenylyltransferase)